LRQPCRNSKRQTLPLKNLSGIERRKDSWVIKRAKHQHRKKLNLRAARSMGLFKKRISAKQWGGWELGRRGGGKRFQGEKTKDGEEQGPRPGKAVKRIKRHVGRTAKSSSEEGRRSETRKETALTRKEQQPKTNSAQKTTQRGSSKEEFITQSLEGKTGNQLLHENLPPTRRRGGKEHYSGTLSFSQERERESL